MTVTGTSARGQAFYVSLEPYIGSQGVLIDPVDRACALLTSPEFSRKHKMMAWCATAETLFVACVDKPAVDDLREITGGLSKHVSFQYISEKDLEYAQDRVYGLPENLADIRLGGILVTMDRIQSSDLIFALQRQPTSGGRIGSILSSDNRVNHWNVAEGLAQQYHLPLYSLSDYAHVIASDTSLNKVWSSFDETFWSRNMMAPIALAGNRLTLATADPGNQEVIESLADITKHRINIVVTGYRDIVAIYSARFGKQHELRSRQALVDSTPETSAHITFSRGQKRSIFGLLCCTLVALVVATMPTLVVINVVLQGFYMVNTVVRLWWILRSIGMPLEVAVTKGDINALDRTQLPVYTILVPLYKEASVLPTLKRALIQLDYPKDRLDVKFLLESDDVETIAAAKQGGLPNYVDLVIVPSSEPKTKPKACNYGLHQARGEYVVIFDAEDIPESDQLLKAMSVFAAADKKVVCVQAKLSYFNGSQNVLTRWFTAEYAMWFDLLLPALFSSDLPIPLGGTSNHFRTDVLRDIGAWDPYNVTEDADLGIRLHRAGYRTAIMNSTTHEEANSEFVNWIRQRSRWVKGYMQTWLVHMRHPVALWKDLGPHGFLGYQIIVGGTPFTFLLNPVLWTLTTAWFTVQTPLAHALFPGWLYYTAFLNLLLGNFAFTYSNVTGMARRGAWGLVKYAVLSPVYWTFMSVAAWKGAWQLITRPSYWEKTEHGLSNSEQTSFADVG